jgi:hypothetical protein
MIRMQRAHARAGARLGALALIAAAALAGALVAAARAEGESTRFACVVQSAARDGDGNLLSVVLAVDPSDANAAGWADWAQSHLGARVYLSASTGMYYPQDVGRLGPAATTATATFELEAPGQLSFTARDGMAVTLWHRDT